MTVGHRLKEAGGFPSGFEYLRFALAVSVVVWHSVYISYGAAGEVPFWSGWQRPFIYAILPAFFGMGGFLVTASIQRNTIPAFLALRFVRIYPALLCDIVIAAFVLGPLLTTLPLFDYFSHEEFRSYLLNLGGSMHYKLPGVFEGNPSGSDVNRQLWTIPYEFVSYGAIAVVAMLGIIRRPRTLFVLICVATAYATYKDVAELELVAGPPGRYLILACLWGTYLYLRRDCIPHSPAMLAVAAASAYALLSFEETTCLSALPVVYIVVWLGTFNPVRRFPVLGTDFSYGIYVYGYPIQQVVAYALPDHRVWYLNAFVGVFFAWVAAYFSWHYVESVVLRRKKDVIAAANHASEQINGWLNWLLHQTPLAVPSRKLRAAGWLKSAGADTRANSLVDHLRRIYPW